MSQNKSSKFKQLFRNLRTRKKLKHTNEVIKHSFSFKERLGYIRDKIQHRKVFAQEVQISSVSNELQEEHIEQILNLSEDTSMKPMVSMDVPTLDPGKGFKIMKQCTSDEAPGYSEFAKSLIDELEIGFDTTTVDLVSNIPVNDNKDFKDHFGFCNRGNNVTQNIKIISATSYDNSKIFKVSDTSSEKEFSKNTFSEGSNLISSVNELISLIDNECNYYNSLPRTLLNKELRTFDESTISMENTVISDYSLCY